MSKIDKLTEKFRREGEKTLEFFSRLPGDIWEKQLYADGVQWSVKQVLAHIVESEGSHMRLVDMVLSGGEGVGKEYDIDGHNANSNERFAQLPTDELIQVFDQQRKKTIETIDRLSDDDLGKRGHNPFLGETTIYEMLRLIYLHINLHIRDVRTFLEAHED